ncbi:MAG: hypothetical protein PVI40_05965 [Chlamydiota bacterium]|jgi:hypothetical protein
MSTSVYTNSSNSSLHSTRTSIGSQEDIANPQEKKVSLRVLKTKLCAAAALQGVKVFFTLVTGFIPLLYLSRFISEEVHDDAARCATALDEIAVLDQEIKYIAKLRQEEQDIHQWGILETQKESLEHQRDFLIQDFQEKYPNHRINRFLSSLKATCESNSLDLGTVYAARRFKILVKQARELTEDKVHANSERYENLGKVLLKEAVGFSTDPHTSISDRNEKMKTHLRTV